VHCDKTE